MSVDDRRVVELRRTKPTKPCGRLVVVASRRVRRVRRDGQIVEFEEAERVDDLEAGSEERRGGGREQGTGAQRGGTLRTCVGDPRLDMVPVGHHVMIEQHEMRDVGVVGPSTETSPDGMFGRRRVHGTEGTRTSECGDRTAPDASAPVVA